jgi:hypothetical protein
MNSQATLRATDTSANVDKMAKIFTTLWTANGLEDYHCDITITHNNPSKLLWPESNERRPGHLCMEEFKNKELET